MKVIDPDVLRQCLLSSLLSSDHRTRISCPRLITLLPVQALYKTELLLQIVLQFILCYPLASASTSAYPS